MLVIVEPVRRLTQWSAGFANPEAPSNYRMQDGPALGDPVPAWQLAYGSAFHIDEGGSVPGMRNVTITLERGVVSGSAGPDDPNVVQRLSVWTTNCTFGD